MRIEAKSVEVYLAEMPEDVPLDVVGRAIKKVPVKKFVAFYESVVNPPAKGRE